LARAFLRCSDRLRWRSARSNHRTQTVQSILPDRQNTSPAARHDRGRGNGGIHLVTPASVLRAQNLTISTEQPGRGPAPLDGVYSQQPTAAYLAWREPHPPTSIVAAHVSPRPAKNYGWHPRRKGFTRAVPSFLH